MNEVRRRCGQQSVSNNAVNCLDYKVPTDVAAYDAMVPMLEKVAPRFGAAIAYSGLTCAFWPVHPTKEADCKAPLRMVVPVTASVDHDWGHMRVENVVKLPSISAV